MGWLLRARCGCVCRSFYGAASWSSSLPPYRRVYNRILDGHSLFCIKCLQLGSPSLIVDSPSLQLSHVLIVVLLHLLGVVVCSVFGFQCKAFLFLFNGLGFKVLGNSVFFCLNGASLRQVEVTNVTDWRMVVAVNAIMYTSRRAQEVVEV